MPTSAANMSSGSRVDVKHLFVVKTWIGKDWKDLGRLMGIPEAELNILQRKESSKNSSDLTEVAYQMLRKWIRKLSYPPTMEELLEHLHDVDRADIADRIISSVSGNKWSSTSHIAIGHVVPNCSERSPSPRGVIGHARERRLRDGRLFTVKAALVHFYAKLTICYLPWMARNASAPFNSYVAPCLEFTNKIFSSKLSVNDFFNSLADTLGSSRILVEGPAGCGKTTFAAKLCYDWSQKLLNFDLTLFLPLRKFMGGFSELLDLAPGLSNEAPNLQEVIKDKARKILLVLDGFNEILDDGNQQALLSHLKSEQLSHLVVVVTSRPQNRWGKVTNFWNEKIILTGMDKKQQKALVRCYEKSLNINPVNADLLLNTSNDLTKYPLMLLMALSLPTELLKQCILMNTITDLYKITFKWVIKNYLNLKQGTEESELDFICNDDTSEFDDQIMKLGMAALDDVKQKTLILLGVKTFQSAGFFHPQTTDDKLCDDGVHATLHATFFEFAVAYGLHKMHGNLDYPLEKWRNELKKIKPANGSISLQLIVPFLIELMSTDVDESEKVLEVLDVGRCEYNTAFSKYGFKLLDIQAKSSNQIRSRKPVMKKTCNSRQNHTNNGLHVVKRKLVTNVNGRNSKRIKEFCAIEQKD